MSWGLIPVLSLFVAAWGCCTLAVYWGYRRLICGWDSGNWWWRSWSCLALFFASVLLIVRAFCLWT
jgi:hypothetical protein